MVMVSDIVQITITVQSSSVTRKGFNSILLLGKNASFAAGWADFEVKAFTSYQQVAADAEIVAGSELQKMAQTAFAQSPHVPIVYIAKGTTAGLGADDPAADLDEVIANNNNWFGLCIETSTKAAIENAIPWVAANKKYGFFHLASATAPYPVSKSYYSSVWYCETATTALQYLDVAAASRVLAYIPGQVTAAYKTLENVFSNTLTSTEETALSAAFINWYPTVGGRSVTYQGWAYQTPQGFIDTYIGALYLEARIAEDVWAVLASANKIPYTNNGVNQIVNAVTNRLNQSIQEGYLAADPAPIVTAPLVANITPADKSNRLLPNVNFQAWTAGAIHTVQINGIIIA